MMKIVASENVVMTTEYTTTVLSGPAIVSFYRVSVNETNEYSKYGYGSLIRDNETADQYTD